MAILKIARWGHPILRSPSRPVSSPTVPAVRALVHDMIETMQDAGGVGLAAPQVHVPLRLVIFHLPPDRADEAPPLETGAPEGGEAGDGAGKDPLGPLHVLINPTITPIGEDEVLGWEGCLSVPGMRGIVPRWSHIRYTGVGLDGVPFEREAMGFAARVIQHECDHLDGILYPMRMDDLAMLGFNEELDRHPIDVAAVAEELAEMEAEEARQAEEAGGDAAE
jgi:peptide deformylase